VYQYKNLENVTLDEVTRTWNLAFSDYIVPITMTPESIEAYFKVTGVDESKSYGAFYDDTLVGLLVNSVDTFRGETAAYDAMTGIVPEHRGSGLFSKLFEYTADGLKRNGIKRYYLEVITANEKACAIYKKKGGKIQREFSVLEGKIQSDFYSNTEVEILPLSSFPKEEISVYEPSFGNRVTSLYRNIDDYQVANAKMGRRITAAIFSKQGSIRQILYKGEADRDLLRAVLTYLSQNYEKLSISNIPVTETELISELLNVGFKVLVNQYEMCIELL
jgi:GNAT superfamily N-acetyltransferase